MHSASDAALLEPLDDIGLEPADALRAEPGWRRELAAGAHLVPGGPRHADALEHFGTGKQTHGSALLGCIDLDWWPAGLRVQVSALKKRLDGANGERISPRCSALSYVLDGMVKTC